MVAVKVQPTKQHTMADLPRLEGTLIGANLEKFRHDPLKLAIDAFETHGDLVRLRMGPIKYLLVSHPEAVHHILTENQRNYRKDTKGYKTMKKILGEGLVTSNGDFWLRQRRIAQPAFHRDRIQAFADTMVRCTEEMLDAWEPRLARGEKLDISGEMMRLTLRIIGLTMMSIDLHEDAPELGEAITACLVRTDELITAIPGADVLPTAKNRKFKSARRLLFGAIDEVIKKRRAQLARGEEVPADLLTMLLEATDPEDGQGMDDQQLLDEVMTIFLAGHETTANALVWSFRLLAENTKQRAQMLEEIDGAGAGPLTLQDLGQLPYTKQCIQESMRLYPPIWLIGRNSVEDDELMGYQIPGGTNHFISPWLLHRHPRYWNNPDTFDPTRFEGDPKFPKGLYIPFIEGPRQCIGKAFALMEAQLLLANISRRVVLNLEPGQRVAAEPVITLRPANGLEMSGELREPRRTVA